MSDPKKAPDRSRVRRPAREQVLLRIGPATIEAFVHAAIEDAPPEVVLPMVYEIVVVPGPDLLQ